MAESRVLIRGTDELASGSRKLFDRIGEEAPEAFGRVGERAAEETRASVPRQTGALAGSVLAEKASDRATVAMGGDDVPYAGYIEFGGIRGRPYAASGRYLWPAAYTDVEGVLVEAGTENANDEIRGFRWARPS